MVTNVRASISRQNTRWGNSSIIAFLCIVNPIAGITPGYYIALNFRGLKFRELRKFSAICEIYSTKILSP